uniref:Zinc finger and SCAN domain-containing protein 2-like n=1 Tax=Acanthochromis polyacanthus TaxID=80966 RepID=A0A3Q1GLD1_9TELE
MLLSGTPSSDMDATMFQLRSFVHRRLYAAAEEILGEVEKTITLAVHEAEVSRSEEAESLRRQLGLLRRTAELPCDTPPLQENQRPCTPEQFSFSPELPGPSKSAADLCSNDWNFCSSETDLKQIKEEQAEGQDENETSEAAFRTPENVKSEKVEAQVSYEMQPVSSDCTAAPNSDEELVLQGRSSSSNNKNGQAAFKSLSAKGQKDRSFCHLCGKGFQYIGSLMKHIKTHEGKTNCSFCGTTLQSTKELVTHLKGCHSKAYFCDICGKTFSNKRCLRLHEKIHTGLKEFVCQECGKTFHRREHLIVHVRTHSGEKPYHCDVCGKAFSQSQNLTIHKRSHSGERPYHCGLCGKLFNTSSHLKTHMRYHSGEKPYLCDICGKRFRQSGQMTRHRTTHTGERPYACHLCGMRYRFAPNLKVHLQTHDKAAAESQQ